MSNTFEFEQYEQEGERAFDETEWEGEAEVLRRRSYPPRLKRRFPVRPVRRIKRRFPFGPILIVCLWVCAGAMLLYAFKPPLLLLGAITAVFTFTFPIYSVAMLSYRLPLIPDALQGRVNSVFRLVAFGFIPLGSALTGLLIERLGVQTTVLFFSLCLLGVSLLLTLNRDVRQARRSTGG